MSNYISTSYFLLLEFSDVRELQILYFLLFLGLYLTTMTGNLLIIITITLDHNLHTPMYFFLMNLALMDMGSISVTVPKSMANSLMNSRYISYYGCVTQVFCFFFFIVLDFIILTIMAHDQYIAICKLLKYEAIMNKGACIQMAISAWIFTIIYAALHTGCIFAISFCSNIVNQFFCEVPKLLALSCDNLYLIEVGLLVLSCSVAFGCFIFIIITYVSIFTAVLQMPSEQGRQKVLSTCLQHLIVVSVFMVTGLLVYGKPPSKISSAPDLAFSMIYAIFPSMMNPFIYSMRNKELQTALWKLLNPEPRQFSKHFPRLL